MTNSPTLTLENMQGKTRLTEINPRLIPNLTNGSTSIHKALWLIAGQTLIPISPPFYKLQSIFNSKYIGVDGNAVRCQQSAPKTGDSLAIPLFGHAERAGVLAASHLAYASGRALSAGIS